MNNTILSKLIEFGFEYTGVKIQPTLEIWKHKYSEVRVQYSPDRIVQAYAWSRNGDKVLNIVSSGITPETLEDRLLKKPRYFPERRLFGIF